MLKGGGKVTSMRAMMIDNIWYPALNVAAHFESDFAHTPPPKKAQEMMAVAVAMAAMQEIHKRPFWLQGVSDLEQSPDVRTLCCDSSENGKAPWCFQQDVEVVTYTEYSAKLTLADFVASTKLAANSAYDDLTTILVNVEFAARLPLPEVWSSVLMSTGKNNPVLVLGKIHPSKPIYRLASVHPVVEYAMDFDAPTLFKKRADLKVMKGSLGTKDTQVIDDSEKHCPFEKFGVKCTLI